MKQIMTYASNISVVLGWGIFSFFLWRGLRKWAVDEDKVFNLTFYTTLVAAVVARLVYVATHWFSVFAGKSVLLVVALWVSPGLSWLGALVGGIVAIVLLTRQYGIRLGLVLDALVFSLLPAIIVVEIVSMAVYEIFFLLVLMIVMLRLSAIASQKKWPYGIVGVWFFFFYSMGTFVLEFLNGSRVYWGGLTANQWMLIGIFAECVGVLYVRGGGRETLRPFIRTARAFIHERIKKVCRNFRQIHS